uniref:OBP47-like domain-containing protein n=1 Tax=Ceratitis capitata TaxID=7213 RepID=W8C9N6_CERCA
MKASLVYFAVIFAFAGHIKADDANNATVDCTKPPRFVPPHLCCPVPDLNTEELMEQCADYAKLGPPPPPPPMGNRGPPPRGGPHRHGPHHHPCLTECIFNQTGVLDATRELNVDKFSELLDTAVKDNEEMAAIMEESFETCSAKAAEFKVKIAEKAKDPGFAERMAQHKSLNCSPLAAMIMACTSMETFKNCPTSSWNDSVECNTARDFVKACKRDGTPRI